MSEKDLVILSGGFDVLAEDAFVQRMVGDFEAQNYEVRALWLQRELGVVPDLAVDHIGAVRSLVVFAGHLGPEKELGRNHLRIPDEWLSFYERSVDLERLNTGVEHRLGIYSMNDWMIPRECADYFEAKVGPVLRFERQGHFYHPKRPRMPVNLAKCVRAMERGESVYA